MLAITGKSFKLLTLALITVSALTGCKSNVEEKQGLSAKNVIIIDSFKMVNADDKRENGIKNAAILEKIYSFSLCISDAAVGVKIDRRPVELEGIALDANVTNTSGCLEWSQTINFSYNKADRCHVFNTKIKLLDSKISKDFSYAIDTVANSAADLARSKGCTEQMKQDQREREVTDYDQTIGTKSGQGNVTVDINQDINNPDNVLMIKEIRGTWLGQRDANGGPIIRSDVKYLEYGTQFESCIETQVDDVPLVFADIEVSVDGQKVITRTTDAGCFESIIHLTYEQYSYSRWVEKTLTVTVLKGKLKGERISRNFFINPWEHNGKYVIDAQHKGRSKYNITQSPNPKNNRISIDGIMYILIGNDLDNFKVNDYLNLTTSRTYQVVLTPRIDRGYRFTKEANAQYEKMHDGKFKLKFMIFAPDKGDVQINETNFRDFTYLTGAEEVVDVKDGIINAVISLPIRMADMPRLAMRTVNIFKLEPLTDTGLRNTVVTGFFKAKIPWIKTNVLQSKTLQDNSAAVSTTYDPAKHQDNIKSIVDSINNKTAEEISQEVVDKENFRDLEGLDNEEFISDVNKKAYKEYIQKHFDDIERFKREEIYGVPNNYVDSDASKIYQIHLNKLFGADNVIAHHFFDETKRQRDPIVSLEEGDINTLYDYNYEQEAELVAQPVYRTITKKLCEENFKAVKRNRVQQFLDNRLNGNKATDLTNCLQEPYNYFTLSRTMHAQEVTHTAPKHSVPLSMRIGSYMSAAATQGQSAWSSTRVGAGLDMKLPMGDVFGAGVRVYEYTKGWTDSDSQNINNGDSIDQNLQLTVEKFTIGVEGRFKKCVTFTGKPYVPVHVSNELARAQRLSGKPVKTKITPSMQKTIAKAYYLCDNHIDTYVDESWYYMQAYTPSSALLMDSFGPTEIKFVKVIRGEENYKQLRLLFQDHTKNYVVKRRSNTSDPDIKLLEEWGHLIKPQENPSVASRLLIKDFEGAFPGTITRPEASY